MMRYLLQQAFLHEGHSDSYVHVPPQQRDVADRSSSGTQKVEYIGPPGQSRHNRWESGTVICQPPAPMVNRGPHR